MLPETLALPGLQLRPSFMAALHLQKRSLQENPNEPIENLMDHNNNQE